MRICHSLCFHGTKYFTNNFVKSLTEKIYTETMKADINLALFQISIILLFDLSKFPTCSHLEMSVFSQNFQKLLSSQKIFLLCNKSVLNKIWERNKTINLWKKLHALLELLQSIVSLFERVIEFSSTLVKFYT